MLRRVAPSIFTVCVVACVKSGGAPRVESELEPTCGTPFYREPALQQTYEGWYAKHWRAFRYIPLCRSRPPEATLRFVVLPTFTAPIGIEITLADSALRVHSKRLSGKGGYEPGRIVRDTSFVLPAEDAIELRRLLAAADFMNAPTREPADWTCETKNCMVLDGTAWVFESWSAGRYHVVDREEPNPDRHPGFAALGAWLWRKSSVVPDSISKTHR